MKDDEMIKALGGTTCVARALGCGRSAVSNWPDRGIPGRWRAAVLRLAQSRNVDVDEDAFLRMPAQLASPASERAA